MSWQAVWQRKGQLNKQPTQTTLHDLIKISGFDSGAGQMSDAMWRRYVSQIQKRLNIMPATTICEVGCGAGAFLYPLYQQGIFVTGWITQRHLLLWRDKSCQIEIFMSVKRTTCPSAMKSLIWYSV